MEVGQACRKPAPGDRVKSSSVDALRSVRDIGPISARLAAVF